MTIIIEYIDLLGEKVEAFKAVVAKPTEIVSGWKLTLNALGSKDWTLCFGNCQPEQRWLSYVIQKSLDKWWPSNHPDEKAHFKQTMEIFGMTEEELAKMDDQLKFERAITYNC